MLSDYPITEQGLQEAGRSGGDFVLHTVRKAVVKMAWTLFCYII